MKITGPLFKWFGSKWLSSKHYPEPIYNQIFEPFAGSAGYSLRHFEKDVTLSESNPELLELWSWLIHKSTPALIRDIPIDLPEGADIRALGLLSGQALLLKMWQRTNNVGNCWTTSPWGNKPGQWTANTRARLAEESSLIRHWKVRPETGLSFLESKEAATWFLDPPYQFNYQYKCPPLDYDELARLVHQLHGQVMVCEALCQKTAKAPTWLNFQTFGLRITSRRKTSQNHHSSELFYHLANSPMSFRT